VGHLPAYAPTSTSAILRGQFVDQALNLTLRQIARRLLALRRKRHCSGGIGLQTIVGDRGIQTLAKREDSFPGCRGGETAGQQVGDPLLNSARW
jgi:hypothetical protein